MKRTSDGTSRAGFFARNGLGAAGVQAVIAAGVGLVGALTIASFARRAWR